MFSKNITIPNVTNWAYFCSDLNQKFHLIDPCPKPQLLVNGLEGEALNLLLLQ